MLSALSATQRCELFTLLEQSFVAADADAGVARS
ncbi:Uncharacterised protein [Mycobacteroides abscessus]|nr:Uncharacterised protein [Mycobacteroides abscessus]